MVAGMMQLQPGGSAGLKHQDLLRAAWHGLGGLGQGTFEAAAEGDRVEGTGGRVEEAGGRVEVARLAQSPGAVDHAPAAVPAARPLGGWARPGRKSVAAP